MIALTQLSRFTQRAVCMMLAAVVVTAALSLAAYEVQSTMHEGYSITITQLQ